MEKGRESVIVGRDDGYVGSGEAVGVMGSRGGGPGKCLWRLEDPPYTSLFLGRNGGTRAIMILGRPPKIAEGGGAKYDWLLLGDSLTLQKDWIVEDAKLLRLKRSFRKIKGPKCK
ncbi:uncharacterized protein LOC105778687 [Gossypium raimondii]|uniref:uncharacterized protein LOC105778687 n=1 Tax=Gossypium raimondii TaxID=29730 RepID=UPI00063ADD14|nr:uncharacterized protein LOC105778687 [Gossypium raimondii]